MSQALDRRLSLRERYQLALHVRICAWCLRYQRQLLALRKALQQESEATHPSSESPSLSAEARERMKRALKNS
ncbi:MAG: zf-HC2 domain-containing protein [Acidobacteriota bacterium]